MLLSTTGVSMRKVFWISGFQENLMAAFAVLDMSAEFHTKTPPDKQFLWTVLSRLKCRMKFYAQLNVSR